MQIFQGKFNLFLIRYCIIHFFVVSLYTDKLKQLKTITTMTNIISYMSITQGLSDNFFKTKKSLENDLKPLLETNGDIVIDTPLYINFYGIGGCNVNKIILGDGDSVLLCNEDNNIYQHITDICDIDDFYNLCKELGV